jgi:hypothetical protein
MFVSHNVDLRAQFQTSVARTRLGVALVAAAGAFVASDVVIASQSGTLGYDLKLSAARTLLTSGHLYPDQSYAPGLHGFPQYGYPYPPLMAMLLIPLAWLPVTAAHVAGFVLCMAAVLAALWVVGCRDPRCFAVAAASPPVIACAQMGNASAFVCLLVALAWRYGAVAAGGAIALKLYAWPLALWLAFTRGVRHFALACAAAAVFVLAPWALIGFDGVTRYVAITEQAADSTRGDTFALSMSRLPHAVVVAAVLTAAALAGCWLKRADLAGSFALAVLATMTAAPILWGFYFTAVFVVLALRRPTLSVAWGAPLVLYFVHQQDRPPDTLDMLAWWSVMGGLLVWCGLGAPRLSAGFARRGRRSLSLAAQRFR